MFTFLALICLITGLVLNTLPPHFAGQHPVAHILIWVGAIVLALTLVVWLSAASTAKRQFKNRDDFFGSGRL